MRVLLIAVAACLVLAAPASAASTTLVINEVDYDQAATDTAEFVELKNVSSAAINLDPYSLQLVDGNARPATVYRTVDLPDVALAAGDHYVVCGNQANTANCDLDVTPDTDLIQDGSPDAIGLRLGETLVDTVSYEGSTGAPYTERFGAGTDDGRSGISRCEDGSDADRNDLDFKVRPTTPGAANSCALPFGECGDGDETPIHDIQGNGAETPVPGSQQVIEGVVVGDFQGPGGLGGFFVQEEDAEADADPNTSEGLFVASANPVDAGDVVRVLGTAVESFGRTQLGTVTNLAVCPSEGSVSATQVALPIGSPGESEPREGMLVTIPQSLSIGESSNFDRFNETVLTVGRQYQPTAVYEPGSPEAAALAQAHQLGRITLDDGRNAQNPDPAIHPNGGIFDLGNRFRDGDTVANVTGVLDFAFGLYRIQPTESADYSVANARPDGAGRRRGRPHRRLLQRPQLLHDAGRPRGQHPRGVPAAADEDHRGDHEARRRRRRPDRDRE